MTYKIRCHVSGGVTGTREAWMKKADGSDETFDTREQAEACANEMNRTMNSIYSTAWFRYVVEQT
jgi:hypothetical protein